MIAPAVAPQTTSPMAEARRLVRVHVRRGVARQLVRGVAEADEERADQQERERGGDEAAVGDDRADDPDRVARRQGRPGGRGGS